MTVDINALLKFVLSGLGAGFLIYKVILPAFRWWMEKEYQTKASNKTQYEEIKGHLKDIREIMQTYVGWRELDQRRLTELETKTDVFWRMIEKATADLLHRDDTPDIDLLLEKIRDYSAAGMSPEERRQLRLYLVDIENSDHRRNDKVAARLLRASIEERYPE